ncbi:hypothetical protein GCM10010430_54760 [Kitasatospora cystarginea]|uniref:Uncharacterized protein n=1 Tax=Kitasatospora cystarginea TaxID=58350 RepID=A0ABN3EMC7_9ACTN
MKLAISTPSSTGGPPAVSEVGTTGTKADAGSPWWVAPGAEAAVTPAAEPVSSPHAQAAGALGSSGAAALTVTARAPRARALRVAKADRTFFAKPGTADARIMGSPRGPVADFVVEEIGR